MQLREQKPTTEKQSWEEIYNQNIKLKLKNITIKKLFTEIIYNSFHLSFSSTVQFYSLYDK